MAHHVRVHVHRDVVTDLSGIMREERVAVDGQLELIGSSAEPTAGLGKRAGERVDRICLRLERVEEVVQGCAGTVAVLRDGADANARAFAILDELELNIGRISDTLLDIVSLELGVEHLVVNHGLVQSRGNGVMGATLAVELAGDFDLDAPGKRQHSGQRNGK